MSTVNSFETMQNKDMTDTVTKTRNKTPQIENAARIVATKQIESQFYLNSSIRKVFKYHQQDINNNEI